MIEVGIYAILLFRENKKNILYYISFIPLIFIPFFQIGNASDFCMRASIPAIVLIDYMVLNKIFNSKEKDMTYNILILVLFIGFMTSFTEITRNINYYIDCRRDKNNYLYDSWNTLSDKKPKEYSNFLSENYKKTLFYKYIEKR
jgi:hypothetical protein